MAEEPKSKKRGSADPAKPQAEVLAKADGGVKVDANESMSYSDYIADRSEPVITIQHIIERRAKPAEKKRTLWPNMKIIHNVMWTPMQPDPPPRPTRLAATIHTEVMYAPPAPVAPPPSIANMEPSGRK